MDNANESTNTLGEFFNKLRIDRNMSQHELSARSGLVIKTISRLENGQDSPRPKTCAAVLTTLRAAKPLSNAEIKFCKHHVNLPGDYNLTSGSSPQRSLTIEVAIARTEVSMDKWLSHTMNEIVATVGRKRALEIILDAAHNRGISIPQIFVD